ncbi:hypothetical protein BDV96DRAFT_592471 [Lophiotrema nucula]|uniref:Uncharacterized protein n=1 Tax=Lophiotrema nucula TaxID=690887 RepID=A0A6A5YGY6_9PLEO|nr:hypothetical protein BDV96DRAFT_592471 [Lophiotrema nucula]
MHYSMELPAEVPSPQRNAILRQARYSVPRPDNDSSPTPFKYESFASGYRPLDDYPSTRAHQLDATVQPVPYPAISASTSSFPARPVYSRPVSAPVETFRPQSSCDSTLSAQQLSYPIPAIAAQSQRPTIEQRSQTQPVETYSSRRMRNQKNFMDLLGGLDEG